MERRSSNPSRVTVAQRKACDKLREQTIKLGIVIMQAENAGVPLDDCYAMVGHLLNHCQQPLLQDIHPAVTAAVECVHTAMDTLTRHTRAVGPSSSPGPEPA